MSVDWRALMNEVREFRWPVTDPARPYDALIEEARARLDTELGWRGLRAVSAPSLVPAWDGDTIRVRVLVDRAPAKAVVPEGRRSRIPARPATRGGRHRAHLRMVDELARTGGTLRPDRVVCSETGCDSTAGAGSGLCTLHVKAAHNALTRQRREAAS